MFNRKKQKKKSFLPPVPMRPFLYDRATAMREGKRLKPEFDRLAQQKLGELELKSAANGVFDGMLLTEFVQNPKSDELQQLRQAHGLYIVLSQLALAWQRYEKMSSSQQAFSGTHPVLRKAQIELQSKYMPVQLIKAKSEKAQIISTIDLYLMGETFLRICHETSEIFFGLKYPKLKHLYHTVPKNDEEMNFLIKFFEDQTRLVREKNVDVNFAEPELIEGLDYDIV